LRAIRDILREETRGAQVEPGTVVSEEVNTAAEREMAELATQYEAIRRDMPPSGARTRRMSELFSAMRAKAAAVLPLLAAFEQSASPGRRLAAVAILQMFPQIEHVDWLVERMDPESERPFLSYQAAVALAEAARGLAPRHCSRLITALQRAIDLAGRLPDDPARLNVLQTAREELNQKCVAAGHARP
jgi:hypothetical protein